MIKVVPDANVILSGMLGSPGPTRKIINFALAKKLVMFGSSATYKEFCEKIRIGRLQKYLRNQLYTPDKIILDYKSFINMVEPLKIHLDDKIVLRDPDDDEYFKVAQAAHAKIIISRDKDLLDIAKYKDIIVVTPEKFTQSMSRLG